MDLTIICQGCHGSGLRVNVVGYAGNDLTGEMVVPATCTDCDGTGRIRTTGWSPTPHRADT